MNATDPGSRREPAKLAVDDSVIRGLAVDHRASLRSAFVERGLPRPSADLMQSFKTAIVRTLGASASMILLDHRYGEPARAELPVGVSLAMPLDADSSAAAGDMRGTRFDHSFSAAQAVRYGASATKVLLPYRPDVLSQSLPQRTVARQAIDRSHRVGLAAIIEPIVYRLSHETQAEFEARFPFLVGQTLEQLRVLDPDLFKVQFPLRGRGTASAIRSACEGVTAAAGNVPWVVLGGDTGADELAEQVGAAVRSGAMGFMIGRPIWGVAIAIDAGTIEERLARDAARLLTMCSQAAREAATATDARRG